jgi:hypothetical protein
MAKGDTMRFSPLPATRGSYNLVIAPHAGVQMVIETTARLAVSSPVRLIDCGNRSNVYPITKVVRRLTTDVNTTLDRIHISRAFTCYQVLAMLSRSESRMPTLVIDLLCTFLDEAIRFDESCRLLDRSIEELKRLSQTTPMLVTVKPLLAISAERISLLDAITQNATSVYQIEDPDTAPVSELQPSLF